MFNSIWNLLNRTSWFRYRWLRCIWFATKLNFYLTVILGSGRVKKGSIRLTYYSYSLKFVRLIFWMILEIPQNPTAFGDQRNYPYFTFEVLFKKRFFLVFISSITQNGQFSKLGLLGWKYFFDQSNWNRFKLHWSRVPGLLSFQTKISLVHGPNLFRW